MIDEAFISRTIQRGREARDKALTAFEGLSAPQFNWNPSPGSWSIAQCLDHLVLSDSAYFQALQQIAEGTHTMTWWEKYSPLSSLFGKALRYQLKEDGRRKIKTSRKQIPSSSERDLSFFREYINNLDTFLGHISACRQADLDRTIIRSPMVSLVTYSLRDTFHFLLEHEHRHINQAIRVRERPDFPSR